MYGQIQEFYTLPDMPGSLYPAIPQSAI